MNTFFEKIKAFFSSVEEFLMPFIRQFLTAEGPIILAAAEKAVLALAASSLSGVEKRNEAFNAILSELKEKGIKAGTAVINSAIEACVAKIQEPS